MTIDQRDTLTLLLHDRFEAYGWEATAMRGAPPAGLRGRLRRSWAALLREVRDMWEAL